jgi:glycosyltransferase involved in cell wall biosynthesis
MLASIVAQSYSDWSLILIDDCSSETEIKQSKSIISVFKELLKNLGHDSNKIEVHWNSENGRGKQWEVSNVLYGIKRSKNDDIICRIDADDCLTDIDALQILNSVYDSNSMYAVWTAHRWGFSDKNISGPLPKNADVYSYPWVSSHLKTFRKFLINNVPMENFTNQHNEIVKRCGDQAIYLPVLHIAQSDKRSFIPRCMYRYTINDVPETYQTDDALFQRLEAEFVRSRGFISSGVPWESVIQ